MRPSLALPPLAVLLSIAVTGGVAGARPNALPRPRVLATCADFSNQAAAQRAHNTRDADGDGIYCEALPCPCLKPGQGTGGGGRRKTPAPTAKPQHASLGRSITLHAVRRHSGCHVNGPLPDARCTPGAYYSKATKARVCRPGYSKQVRDVPQATKNAIYDAYGISTHFNGSTGEVDHLVSLELGGSNVRANLFPEAASPKPGSHEKDKLENRLSRLVCRKRISLRFAQRLIATDWLHARQWVIEHFPNS